MTTDQLILGKTYTLKINRFVDFGAYLDALNLGEILIPARYVPEGKKEEDMLEVFVYKDSEDRLIATTEKPYTQVGEFAALEVKAVTSVGAFLEWGLTKDLLVPFVEQKFKMEVGQKYLVFTYVDVETERIAASSKLDQFLSDEDPDYQEGEEVDIIINDKSDLGYKVIINKSHWGLIYGNQVFEKIEIGDKRKAYISKVRDDHKIDLTLTKVGGALVDEVAIKLYQLLKKEKFIGIHDKSSPEEIKQQLGTSKKAFKKAIGTLYKRRLISLVEGGIRIVEIDK